MKIILNSAAACSRGASLILVFPTISPLLLILIRILIAVLFVLLTWHFVREFILSFARCKLHLCDYGQPEPIFPFPKKTSPATGCFSRAPLYGSFPKWSAAAVSGGFWSI